MVSATPIPWSVLKLTWKKITTFFSANWNRLKALFIPAKKQIYPIVFNTSRDQIIKDLNEVCSKLKKPCIVMALVLLETGEVRSLGRQFVIGEDTTAEDLYHKLDCDRDELLMRYYGDFVDVVYLRVLGYSNVTERKKFKELVYSFAYKPAGLTVSERYLPFHMDYGSLGVSVKEGDFTVYKYLDDVDVLVKPSDSAGKYCGFVRHKRRGHLFDFQDTRCDDGFTRVIGGNTTIHFGRNGSVKSYKVRFPEGRSLEKVKKEPLESSFQDIPIITLDIETYKNSDGKFIPYAIAWCAGSRYNHLRKDELNIKYLTDFKSSDDMVMSSLRELFVIRNHGYVVYAHNLGGFDGPFLLKSLLKMPNMIVEPKMWNGKLQSIKAKLNLSKLSDDELNAISGVRGGTSKLERLKFLSITFKDSYQLLPCSLKSLCTAFEVPVQKGDFPHEWVNEENICYVGCNPFDSADTAIWSTREKCFEYLTKDVISLHQILLKFRRNIQAKFSLKVEKYVSLPALSYAIYRSNFLCTDEIALTSGTVHNNIKNAYYGGIVDVYKPSGENLYYYDVNSLYPFAMLSDMPAGAPTFVWRPSLKDSFGFYLADIVCGSDVAYPTLPYKDKDGLLCPRGCWSGWYFSEELKDCEKQGYQVNLLYGYEYKRGKDFFKDFVNSFYNEKRDAPTPADRLISKLIMNSLYGRFGMSNEPIKNLLVSDETLAEISQYHEIIDYMCLGDDVCERYRNFVKFKGSVDKDLCELNDYFEINCRQDNLGLKLDVAVTQAAAITAYARIHMNQFKRRSDIYYSDTDSVVVKEPLNDCFVGSDIGLFKLEYKIQKGYFLAPKVYYFTHEQGDVVKVKGVKTGLISPDQILQYFKGNAIETNMDFWRRHTFEGITIERRKIVLDPQNFKKREKVFDSDGLWIDTKPITISESRARKSSATRNRSFNAYKEILDDISPSAHKDHVGGWASLNGRIKNRNEFHEQKPEIINEDSNPVTHDGLTDSNSTDGSALGAETEKIPSLPGEGRQLPAPRGAAKRPERWKTGGPGGGP